MDENEIETIDSENDTIETEDLVDLDIDTETATMEELAELKSKNAQLYARAKKAEAEIREAKKIVSKPEPKKEKAAVVTDDFDKRIGEAFEKRDLEATDYSDGIKAEISKLAKMQGVSIKQASKDPYIQFQIEAYNKEQKTQDATISRTNKSGGRTTASFDEIPDVDMNTEEGRKEYDAWTKEMVKAGN